MSIRYSTDELANAVARRERGDNINEIVKDFPGYVHNVAAFQKRLDNFANPKPRNRRFEGRTLNLPDDIAQLGYIAGIVDGEGSISKSGKAWTIVVYNTDKGLMDWLSSFGGRSYVRTFVKEPRFPTKRTQYGWVVARQLDVLYLSEKLEPYLLIKKDRARQAQAEIRLRGSFKDDGSGLS